MRLTRRSMPWVLSLLLLLLTGATALATVRISSTNVYNKDRYWDSPTWRNGSADSTGTITLKCRDESDSNDPNDWVTIRIWRHAGIFPPYSVGDKDFTSCRDTAKAKTWTSNMGGAEDFHFQIRAFSANGGYDGSHLIDLIPYSVETN